MEDKRRNSEGNQHYEVKKLWESHNEMSRLIILGYKNVDIARTIGCTPQTVSNIRNSPQMKRKLSIMSQARDGDAIDMSQRLKEITPIAIEVFEDVMKAALEDEVYMEDKDLRKDAITSAKAVIDHSVPKQTQGRILHGFVTLDDINEAKRRALGLDENNVEEAEFKELEENNV